MMSKKILSVVLTIAMIATVLCMGAVVASADTELHAGDQVKVTLSVKPYENIGGLCDDITYDSSVLNAVSAEQQIAGSFVANVGSNPIAWNQTFDPMYGYSFNDEPVVVITFDVIADTTLEALSFSSDVWELFDINYNLLDGNQYVYISNVEAIDNTNDSDVSDSDSDTDTATDSEEPVSDTDTATDSEEPVSDTDTATDSEEPVSDTDSVSDTDTASESDTDTTVSEPTSSVTSSEAPTSSTTSDSDKKNTQDNASSKTSSTTSNKTTSTATATVQTAGTIAVISLVVILMAAGAVVLFAKKKAEQE